MKVKFLALIIIALVAGSVQAEDLRPILGSTTNTSFSITNSVKDQYLISAALWGAFDGTNAVSISITFPDTDTIPMVLAGSTNTTSSLSFIDGAAGMLWQRLSVMTFTASSDGVTTNGYFVQTTTKPRP